MQKIKACEVLRLDMFLAKHLGQSRSQVAQLIKSGGVKINGEICDKSAAKLKINDEIELLEFAPQKPTAPYEINFDIEVLFEDEDLLVLNKPAGVVVHSATSVKEATLVDWLLAKGYALSNLNGQIRAGLVHRLDKGTSGAMIVAKNNATHQFLSAQLLDKSMGRFYLALINLPLKDDIIIVEKPLIRSPKNRLKKIALKEHMKGARAAKSAFVNLLTQNGLNLIVAKLFTGRTHQIRAHLESLNRHILGDELYGYRGKKMQRVMLHSYFLYFIHPKSKEICFVKAPFYDDFAMILNEFDKGEFDEKISLDYIKHCFNACV